MGDETIILRKSKEWREWGTFLLSLLTLVIIPVGLLVLRNQRMEMRQESDSLYVPKVEYKENTTHLWDKVNATNDKLDSMKLDLVHLNDSVSALGRTLIETSTTRDNNRR